VLSIKQKAQLLGLFVGPELSTQFTSATFAKWVPSSPGHGPVNIVGLPCKSY
jgi:hypothetical protein